MRKLARFSHISAAPADTTSVPIQDIRRRLIQPGEWTRAHRQLPHDQQRVEADGEVDGVEQRDQAVERRHDGPGQRQLRVELQDEDGDERRARAAHPSAELLNIRR